MGQPVEVEIMGHRLTVTSDDSEEHLREIAGYLDQRMRQLANGRLSANSLQLALLTALNIASEYWKLQREEEEVSKRINRMAQHVSARIGRPEPSVRKGEEITRR